MECPACRNVNREDARFCDSCGTALGEPQEAAVPEAERPGPDEVPGPVGGGRYRLRSFLGKGGRKRVYLADDLAEDREVAVAVFETEGVEETVLARARREAQAMGKLGDHPHIVSVFDTGEEDGRPYIVSRYLSGGDVASLLDAQPDRRLPTDRALEIAVDVCGALEHAHARGIVHRDIKPANVWLDREDRARLGDFGLAATDSHSRAAVEGMLVGTVAYLPPEQALGRGSGPRSDLYSLGGLLYEMLTGQPPFEGDDAVSIISQHLNAEPVAPSRHRPGIPRAVDGLVLRLLAKTPEARPESASEVRAELEALIAAPPEAEEPVAGDENPLDRLAGGVFVGRERELDEMRESLEDSLGGRGHVLLLVGEPGIGKTRTAEELATYARVRGARVHWGRSHEGEGAPAYWPWTQALRSYVRDADPVGLAWELGPAASEVAQLVPELRERVGGVSDSASLDPEQDRFRLFDGVFGFLANASRSRPLVLILDDLHWADEPSLLLLKFVARQLSDTGLLVVGTYRDVELGRHHPLADTLAELAELEQTRRISLRGLDHDDVERFIEMTAGVEPPPRLAEAVYEQTEGNPFFLGEVVRLLVSEGRLEGSDAERWELALPQGVREVVGRRLDRLSSDANAVLTQAAAIGREFDRAVLDKVAGCPPDEVTSALEEATEARVVGEASRAPGRFGFSHALVRETLYAEIPSSKRVQVHREIGEALEQLHGPDSRAHLAEIAHHFLEAAPGGDVDKAVGYAERAARLATEQLAHEAAAAHYERALQALEASPAAGPRRRLGLLIELGQAQTRAGRFVAARRSLERATELARELDDAHCLVSAVLGIAALSEAGGVDERIVALIREALATLPEGDSPERALLLSGLAQEIYWRDPRGEAASLNDEAIGMARRLGDRRVLATTLTRRQFDIGASLEERLTMADELIALAEEVDASELVVRGHAYRLNNLLMMGEVAQVDSELEAYARLAAELRQPQHLWHVPLLRATRALMDGRFDDAVRLSREALAQGQRAQEPLSAQFHAIQMATLHTLQGTAAEMLPGVREMAKRYPAIRAWALALVAFLCEAGRLEEARPEFERVVAAGFEDLPLDAQYVTGLALISRACARLEDTDRAPLLYELLAPYDGMAVVAGRAASCNGPVALYLGALAHTMSRTQDAVRHFEDAVGLATRMGDVPFLAQSRQGLAAAMLARGASGDQERALELLGRALEAGQELGMRNVVRESLALRLEAQGLSAVDVTTSIDTMISAVESERPDVRSFAAPDGTVTILFSDIENSTLMTERLGDERWLAVLRAHNSIFREHVRAHGGHEVKSQGDGFMLVFPDPTRAMECAIAIQRDLADREVANGERIRVRMGLHAGEAIREEGDFFGRSVILAARIAAQARGGEILVSEALRDMAGSDAEEDGGIDFDSGRELELKGLAGTHRVFSAGWEPQPAPA